MVEALRWAKLIFGSKMRRLKTRVIKKISVPEDRPQDTTNNQLKPSQICNLPKTTPQLNLNTKKCPKYKSTLHLMIDKLEDSINFEKVKLVSAKDYLKENLEQMFSNSDIKQSKANSQCSQCHLRLDLQTALQLWSLSRSTYVWRP